LSHDERPVSCRGCWSFAGRSCIACGETPAQNARDLKSRCKSWLHGKDRAALAMFVEPETLAYLAREVPSQSWDGSEPALQLLVLPEAQAEPLPSYPMRPEHVAQEHCRLCLWSPTAPVAPETRPSPEILEAARWGIAASVAAHVRSEHGMSPSEYRAAVSRRVAGHWPEPVWPPTRRGCLTRSSAWGCEPAAPARSVAASSSTWSSSLLPYPRLRLGWALRLLKSGRRSGKRGSACGTAC
jgi:hypothetical protein